MITLLMWVAVYLLAPILFPDITMIERVLLTMIAGIYGDIWAIDRKLDKTWDTFLDAFANRAFFIDEELKK